MSLRLRLLMTLGVLTLVALTAADFVTYSALQSYLYNQVDQTLVLHRLPFVVNEITGQVKCPGPGNNGFVFGGGPPQSPGSDSEQGAPNALLLAFVEIRDTNGHVVDGLQCPAFINGAPISPVLPGHIGGLTSQPDGSQAVNFTAPAVQPNGPAFRVRASNGIGSAQLPNGDQLVVAEPIAGQTSTLHTLFLTEIAVTAAAIILAIVGGWWMVRISLRPLTNVEETAEEIAEGALDQRVPGVENNTEVGRLIRTFNKMLERIESSFSAKEASEAKLKEFVADASHELRTPIAAVSAYAQLFDVAVSRNPNDVPRILLGIRNETQRMEGLVNDLLMLARLDEGLSLTPQPIDLVELCSERIGVSLTIGPEWPVKLEASHPVDVVADRDRIGQVIDNLLNNVRAHTPAGTSATVAVDHDDTMVSITVRDNGPGISPEQAARLFERFYRIDPSRSRVQGGAGLGLSIVEAIVKAHLGSVSAESDLGRGLAIRIQMPCR